MLVTVDIKHFIKPVVKTTEKQPLYAILLLANFLSDFQNYN